MPPDERYRFEHARVAQRDFSGWWQRMIIRKGSDYGIPVGAPVVYSGGVVGRISEVHAFTSVVQLTSDPGLRIAAVVDGDTRPVSFQGAENQVFGAPKGVIEFVPLDIYASASAQKRLATSGLGGVYPPGLTIGRIVRVESSADGLFKTGDVELDPRLAELTEVTVLVAVAKE
jgi:rod shape-determining protein MreC